MSNAKWVSNISIGRLLVAHFHFLYFFFFDLLEFLLRMFTTLRDSWFVASEKLWISCSRSCSLRHLLKYDQSFEACVIVDLSGRFLGIGIPVARLDT